MNIEPWARIRRTDNVWAKAQKVLYIVWEMNYAGMRIQAIQWLFKMVDQITLYDAYTAVTMRTEDD